MCVHVRARVFILLFLLKSRANKASGSGQEEPNLTLFIKLEINN